MSKADEYAALFPVKTKKKSQASKLEEDLFDEFKVQGIPLPLRQYRFHPFRQWPFDFAWPDRKIAVEIHGGIFMRAGTGGHNRGDYMEKTFEKINEATRLGWRVFTFGPKACNKTRSQSSSEALNFIHAILIQDPIRFGSS